MITTLPDDGQPLPMHLNDDGQPLPTKPRVALVWIPPMTGSRIWATVNGTKGEMYPTELLSALLGESGQETSVYQMLSRYLPGFLVDLITPKLNEWYGTSVTAFNHKATLHYDAGTTKPPNGVHISVDQTNGGQMCSVDNDVHIAMPEKPKHMEWGKTWYRVCYDWRRAGDPEFEKTYFARLQETVEWAAGNTTSGKVVLGSLSQGGPVGTAFLNSMTAEWKKQYIDTWLMVASAIGGSFESFETFFCGEVTLKIPVEGAFSMPELAPFFQAPCMLYIGPNAAIFEGMDVLRVKGGANYTAIEASLEAAKIDNWANAWKEMIKPAIDRTMGDPGVRTIHVFGTDIMTALTTTIEGDFGNCTVASRAYGTGDGAIPDQALRYAGKNWGNVNEIECAGEEHTSLATTKSCPAYTDILDQLLS